MLLDLWDPKTDEKYFPAAVRDMLAGKHLAQRYLFTDEVTVEIAKLVREHPNTLLNNIQFALAPYPVTYLEFNLKLFLKELGTATTALIYGLEAEADETVGFMINKGQVNVIFQGEQKGPPHVSPLSYTLVDHRKLEGYAAVAPRAEDQFLAIALGSTLIHPETRLTEERSDDIVKRAIIWLDAEIAGMVVPDFKDFDRARSFAKNLVMGAMGELRNIWALLLWLNQPEISITERVPARRDWFKFRERAIAAHLVVKVKHRVSYSLVKSIWPAGWHVRQHDVEAFWRNFDRDDTCPHDWPIMPNDKGHWRCTKCAQWRVRVRAHKRGDPKLGIITKEYKV